MIAILTPSRNRKAQFERMCQSVGATSKYTLIISCSNGDDNYSAKQYPIDCPTIFMWNDMAGIVYEKHSDIKLFMLAADDMVFTTPGWDQAVIDHYNALENKIHVYHLRDSRDPSGTPHPIVTREYIDAMGYFLPPLFLHWYADTWTVANARTNNCFTHFTDFELVHDKPSDRGMSDETHLGIRHRGWHRRDTAVWNASQRWLSHDKDLLALKMKTWSL